MAALYWEAFGGKLGHALGPRRHAVAFVAARLTTDRFVCAVRDGEVVGALGYQLAGRSAIDLTYAALARHYSWWSAPWRLSLLLPLHRAPRRHELLLDGVAVSPAARGTGIGTLLLRRALDVGRRHRKRLVRLSVVDTNPRARALYERLGFVARKTTDVGMLGELYGFRRVTDMELPIAPAEPAR